MPRVAAAEHLWQPHGTQPSLATLHREHCLTEPRLQQANCQHSTVAVVSLCGVGLMCHCGGTLLCTVGGDISVYSVVMNCGIDLPVIK